MFETIMGHYSPSEIVFILLILGEFYLNYHKELRPIGVLILNENYNHII